MQVKMLIFDLDGTAVPNQPDGMPSQRVIAAVREAQKLIPVSVATGRGILTCNQILEAFPVRDTCILAGGTQLFNPGSNTIEWEQKLSQSQVQAVLRACAEFPYYIEVEGEVEKCLISQYAQLSEKSILYLINVPIGEEQKMLSALETVPDIAVHAVPAWVPGCLDIHVSHKDATKKHALQVLLQRKHIDPQHVLVVGDGANDAPLFEVAGHKVAMGNAAESLKRLADAVVGTVAQDGLAEAIEQYVLRP